MLFLFVSLAGPLDASACGGLGCWGLLCLCFAAPEQTSAAVPRCRLVAVRGGFLHIAYLVLMGMVVRWAVELLMPLVTQA